MSRPFDVAIVIDPSNNIRPEVAGVIRNLGLQSVKTCATIAEARNALRSEKVDWVVSALCASESENIFSLQKFILETKECSSTCVSLLVENEELSAMTLAFELGALSWHKKLITREFLSEEFENLFKEYALQGNNSTFVAAQYLRRYFEACGDDMANVQLFRKLVETYPNEARLQMYYSEALFRANLGAEALQALQRVGIIDRSLDDEALEIQEKYLGKIQKPPAEMSVAGCRGLGRVVVIDPDDDAFRSAQVALNELGVRDVVHFDGGDKAWSELQKMPEPSLLLMEWRLPKVTGSNLLQRVRAMGFKNVPIVVVSSLLKREDASLLSEMSISGIVAKPIVKKELLLAVNWAVLQATFPSEQPGLEAKIFACLQEKKWRDAQALFEKLKASSSISEGRKKYMEAEMLYAAGKYLAAKDAVVAAIKKSDQEFLATTNLLGKVLLKLGEIESALKFLEKAQSLSSANVERLCTIAEAHIENGNFGMAEDALNRAEKIDAACPSVVNMAIKVTVCAGDHQRAKQMMSSSAQVATLVSFMNTQAILRSNAGKNDEAIDLYNKTLRSIPDDFKEELAAVCYNLSLALIRKDQKEAAKTALERAASSTGKNELKNKVRSLLVRVTDAIASGKSVVLQTSNSAATSVSVDDLEFESLFGPSATPTRSGDPLLENLVHGSDKQQIVCLSGVYRYGERHSEFALSLVKT